MATRIGGFTFMVQQQATLWQMGFKSRRLVTGTQAPCSPWGFPQRNSKAPSSAASGKRSPPPPGSIYRLRQGSLPRWQMAAPGPRLAPATAGDTRVNRAEVKQCFTHPRQERTRSTPHPQHGQRTRRVFTLSVPIGNVHRWRSERSLWVDFRISSQEDSMV